MSQKSQKISKTLEERSRNLSSKHLQQSHKIFSKMFQKSENFSKTDAESSKADRYRIQKYFENVSKISKN